MTDLMAGTALPNWNLHAPEPCEIWLDENLFVTVDQVDYEWARRWKWHATWNSTRKKFYATRNTRLSGRAGPQTKIYMHKEILDRAGKKPPTEKHTIGDHQDGESGNNTRDNLEWATPSINRRNIGGWHAQQAALFRL